MQCTTLDNIVINRTATIPTAIAETNELVYTAAIVILRMLNARMVTHNMMPLENKTGQYDQSNAEKLAERIREWCED